MIFRIQKVSTLSVLLTLMATASIEAADYHVANSGSDSNPGTAASPWRSLSKVNGADLKAGDRVLLKRGDRWAETISPGASGAPGKPITFASYGDGDRPLITGSSGKGCIAWFQSRSHLVFRDLHLSDCGRNGIDVWSDGAMSKDIVVENTVIERSSVTNLYMSGVDGLRIRGNTIRNAGREHGIYLDGSLGINDAVVEENDIHGNNVMCIQFNSNAKNRLTNVTLRYNRLHDCNGGGVNNIGVDGLRAHHNLIFGAMPGIYNDCDGADSGCRRGAANGIYENNTIVTTGDNWATCFANASRMGTPSFASFSNNICVHNAARGEAVDLSDSGSARIDSNLYFSSRRTLDARGENGLVADPRFASLGAFDLALGTDSPARDSGVDLGYTRDQRGGKVPSGALPDRGALEAEATPGVDATPETPQDLEVEFR